MSTGPVTDSHQSCITIMRFVLLFAISGFALAQAQFEAATVKLHGAGAGMGMFPAPGGLRVENYTLRQLLESALHLPTGQVIVTAGWMDSDRFDINARTSAPATFEQELEMLVPLLIERFQIRSHREPRQLRTYALVVRKPGARLQAAKDDGGKQRVTIQPNEISGTRISMGYLASILGAQLRSPVANETGLAGSYDLSLKYERIDAPGSSKEDPTIFSALETLGLKLESRKREVEVMVVDSAARPEMF
jgi:uncharacterized protein (TIGR03435 family)